MWRAVLVAALVLSIASCGGDSETSSTTASEPTQATSTTSSSTSTQTKADQTTSSTATVKADPYASVEAVLVGGDCQKYVTERFVNSAYGDESACEAAVASGGTADSLKTGKISTAGDSATVSIVPHGGPSSGEKVTAKLVLDGGTWKIDSLESNVPVGP